jgi:hypothetical protein
MSLHYEAAWNDSWHFRRCGHSHPMLVEAAECAMPHGCGWYVVAVEFEVIIRDLTETEEEVVNRFSLCRSRSLKNS